MKDREIGTPGEGPYQWRSKEVERQRALELSGVFEAARHPQHGRAANLRKTLGVCIVALAAAGLMVAGGLLTSGTGSLPDRPALVANAPAAAPAAEPNSQVTAQEPRLDLAGLAVLNETVSEAAEPNRASCEAIRGTAYESESERIWFQANCVEEEPIVAFLTAPGVSGAISQPEATPSDEPVALSAGDAIASSVDWIEHEQDVSYDVTTESCSASEVGELWLVSCETSLTGCDDAICNSWISVCVTDARGTLLATRNC